MSEEELKRKFAYCIERAPVSIPVEALSKIVEMVDQLEKIDNVVDIIPLLVV